MTHDQRIQAIADFGFTQSQACFLVLVIRHAGVCIPRQYASFAGAPQGGKRCNALFEKLVRRGFAVSHDCVHNRARLYHLHHKALYLAIRELASRHWRPASSRLWVERVMLLDALLPCADLEWLTTTSERRAWLASVTASTAQDEAQGSTAVEDRPSGGFPRFPVGIESGGRVVLVYLVTEPSIDRFRTFLHSNAALLRALSHWTIRLVFPRPLHRFYDAHQAVIREELETPLHPATVSELKWYFAHRRNATKAAVHPETQRFLDVGAKVFGAPRFSALYRRWLTQGDAVFEALSSPAIADALAEKRAFVESLVLPHSYRLLPLVTRRTISAGVEKGEERGEVRSHALNTLPQHPQCNPATLVCCSRPCEAARRIRSRCSDLDSDRRPVRGGVLCRPVCVGRVAMERNRDVNDPVSCSRTWPRIRAGSFTSRFRAFERVMYGGFGDRVSAGRGQRNVRARCGFRARTAAKFQARNRSLLAISAFFLGAVGSNLVGCRVGTIQAQCGQPPTSRRIPP